ncbi:MAG: hypothetical protein IT361_02060 [Gemmatimonadaceae bacterium]|nr:hypothetical protein [Gemmatimonadaceae bacterium]
MKKSLFLLVLGVAAGYQIGWQDAQTHTESVVRRVIAQVQGTTKGKYGNDVDAQMERLESR